MSDDNKISHSNKHRKRKKAKPTKPLNLSEAISALRGKTDLGHDELVALSLQVLADAGDRSDTAKVKCLEVLLKIQSNRWDRNTDDSTSTNDVLLAAINSMKRDRD